MTAPSAPGEASPTRAFLWKQCDEVALALHLDPEPFHGLVEPELTLALIDGRARVVIIPQDCAQYWMDGEALEPPQLVHVLVGVESPERVSPVVGAQWTMPTMTWFALFTGSTDAGDRERRDAVRMSTGAIEEISLERPEVGSVTVAHGLSYSWQLPAAQGAISLVGVNHEMYSRDDAGRLVFKRVQALARMVGDPVVGTLDAMHGVDPQRRVPPGSYPVRGFALSPVWARVTFGEDPPQGGPAPTA